MKIIKRTSLKNLGKFTHISYILLFCSIHDVLKRNFDTD